MKIFISTGLTGGHLFPAITFGEYLKEKDSSYSILYIVNKRVQSKEKLAASLKYKEVFFLEDNPFKGIFSFKLYWNLFRNFIRTFILFGKERPDFIVGFGSNLSIPIVLNAWIRGIPRIIHEQNFSFGKANKILLPFANGVALSFQETYKSSKAFWSGNILRPMITKQAPSDFFDSEKKKTFNILVMGGSQGAAFINSVVSQAFEEIQEDIRKKLKLFIISGEIDNSKLFSQIKNIVSEVEIFDYYENMSELFRKTDFLIARAGAGTLAEGLAFGLPGIFIPYPHGGHHQLENAKYLEANGAGFVVEENSGAPQKIAKILEALILESEPTDLITMQKNAIRLRKLDGCQVLERKVQELKKEPA